MKWLGARSAAIFGLAGSGISLALAFGARLSGEQMGAIMGFVSAFVGLWGQNTTPVPK